MGLPALDELNAVVRDEMERLPDQIIEGKAADRAVQMLEIGRHNLGVRGVHSEQPIDLSFVKHDFPYVVPSVVLGDDTVMKLHKSRIPLDVPDPLESIELAYRYTRWATGFLGACRP